MTMSEPTGGMPVVAARKRIYTLADGAGASPKIEVARESGIITGAFAGDLFSAAPFLQIGEEQVVAETNITGYLFTPECAALESNSWPQLPRQELTLIARGVTPSLLPWELQHTVIYSPKSNLLQLVIRPQLHLAQAKAKPSASVLCGMQIRVNRPWQAQQETGVITTGGVSIVVPQIPGVSTVVTDRTFTVLSTSSSAILLWISFSHQIQAPGSKIKVSFPSLTSNCLKASNGVPVVSSWEQAADLVQLQAEGEENTELYYRAATSVSRFLPSEALNYRADDPPKSPGRYWLEVSMPRASSAPYQLVFPFRYWPAADKYTPQAEFSQLLLSTDLSDDYVVAYNVVSPHRLYLASDRDDILAEQGRLAYLLYREIGDEDLRSLAIRMAGRLLEHQQPDGGFTFGMSVNGYRADYSDTDADVIQFLLTLLKDPGVESATQERWKTAVSKAARFMLHYQDSAGFFWGRVQRPDTFRYEQQPWFTSYAVVALLESRQAGVLEEEEDAAVNAALKGLDWLCSVQGQEGGFRFDTEGSYADYDDLSNTAVASWALIRAYQLCQSHGDAEKWWAAAERGIRYLLGLELAEQGAFSGRQLPGWEKLVYDYKLGAALAAFLQAMDNGTKQGEPVAARLCLKVKSTWARYLAHIRNIQGRGTISGGWASLYDLEKQAYALDYQWFERGSEWHEYVFLGWQGKLIELPLHLPAGK